MSSRFFIFSLAFSLIISANAIDENFYLIHRDNAQKLIPSTLRCSLQVGDERRVFVEPYPKGAAISEIVWDSASDIIEISPSGSACTIRANAAGICVLSAKDSVGNSCEITVSISSSEPKVLHLNTSAQSISAGDTIFIYAQADTPEAEIIWQVQEDGCAAVSYGGNTCKVNALSEGRVYVRAHILNSNVSSDCIVDINPEHPASNIFPDIPQVLTVSAFFLLMLSFILWLLKRRSLI